MYNEILEILNKIENLLELNNEQNYNNIVQKSNYDKIQKAKENLLNIII